MLSRVSICDQYKLKTCTFDVVEPYLECTPIASNGRYLYKPTLRDEFVFNCARLHPSSFAYTNKGAARLFPFHRFLVLKMMTVSFEEMVADIHQRNLAPKLEVSALRYMDRCVQALVPASIRKYTKARQPPPKELEPNYQLMLSILGINEPYNHPEWLDQFFEFIGDPDQKTLFETVMTARGRVGDWQKALTALSNFQWEAFPLELYASIFYDRNHLSETDWSHYLSLLPPSEREAKNNAATMTTAYLCAHEADVADYTQTMQIAAVALQKKIIETITGGDIKALQPLLVTFNGIGKATGELDGSPATKAGYFPSISIKPAVHDTKSIEDISDTKQASAGA